MRLEQHHRHERFGAVRIHELQRVLELDSGDRPPVDRSPADRSPQSEIVPAEDIRAVERDMVIVVPCRDESRRAIEGVLSAVPHDCLIVLVSDSVGRPVDRFEMELQAIEEFCRIAERPAVVVHQRDPGLAAAFKAAGMPELIDEHGSVRGGRGEGMLVGMAIAAMTGRRYLGYVDADNYLPGAVHEHVKAYAAGLHLAGSPYSMVRIGRHSEITDHFLNRAMSDLSGLGTEVITTGGAGGHALSLALGLRLRPAGGAAAAPFGYVDMFEQFGGVMESADPELTAASVPVLQIETLSPPVQDAGGEAALNVIYHSPVTLPALREEILEFLTARGALAPGQEPPREWVYPPVGQLSFGLFKDTLLREAGTFRTFDGRPEVGPPILPNPFGVAVGQASVPEIDEEPVPIDEVLD